MCKVIYSSLLHHRLTCLFIVKVLLGESPESELHNTLPSKSGLQTVMEVLRIQTKFWPTLGSTFAKLQSQWGMHSLKNKSDSLSLSLSVKTLGKVSFFWDKFLIELRIVWHQGANLDS